SMFVLSQKEGSFGPCLLISRSDYEEVGGHREVKSKVVEDLALAKVCVEKGIPVNNFLGRDYIKFRMYDRFLDLIRGFTKNIAKGAFSINFLTFLLIFLYVIGIYISV
ncbi:hypothetical protein, partial [Escherichia coli]|uniref:hypothetical protein n=1 Tax=Escherichia coli TaxID=562 RepID=UPI0012C788DB